MGTHLDWYSSHTNCIVHVLREVGARKKLKKLKSKIEYHTSTSSCGLLLHFHEIVEVISLDDARREFLLTCSWTSF